MSWKEHLEITHDTAEWFILILTSIYITILSPISFYYAKKFWLLSKQNIAFITSRHTKVIMISVLGWNIYPTIIRPIVDFTKLRYLTNEPLYYQLSYQSFQFLIALSCIRLWLLYFDYSSGVHQLSSIWKTSITKSQMEDYNGNTGPYWTIKHKWLGNVKVVMFIGFFITVLFIFTVIISGEDILNYTELMVVVLWILSIVIMLFKIHKCRDEFSIQKEFKILTLFMTAGTLLYLGVILLLPDPSHIVLVITNVATAMGCYGMCLISTLWVVLEYDKQRHANIKSRDHAHQNNIENRMTLEQILSSKHGFDLFANHLVKEFSIENLVFLFEVMQMKKFAIVNRLIAEDRVGVTFPIAAERINKFSRKSSASVIYGIENLRQNVRIIMEQYMWSESAYCINVSSLTRISALNDYERLRLREHVPPTTSSNEDGNDPFSVGNETPRSIDGLDIEDESDRTNYILRCVTIFDRAANEVINLLKLDSLWRFYRSKEYEVMTQMK